MGRLAGRIGKRQRHRALGHLVAERAMREGLVLSRRRPSKPCCMDRSCQRQTQVFDLPVRCMISFVPTPSALKSTMTARQACCRAAFRSLVTASRRLRSDGLGMMEIPVRMPNWRAHRSGETHLGLLRQVETTSSAASAGGALLIIKARCPPARADSQTITKFERPSIKGRQQKIKTPATGQGSSMSGGREKARGWGG